MFGFGSKKFLGVDIGSSGIKVAEVKFQGDKPYLTNYAWMQFSGIKGVESTLSLPDEFISLCLRRMIKEAGFDSEKVNLSIPASGGLITLIEFPETIEKDLAQAIRFEAHKYIPTALEDVVFSWDIVKRESIQPEIKAPGMIETKAPKTGSKKIEVLLVAASKSKVSKFEKIIQDAGLDLESIEIESFSLSRSLIGSDQGNFLIIDIGHRICNIILVEKGIIKVNRNIDAGGRDITRVIARNMNLDDSRAEQVKLSTANFFSSESSIVFPALDVVVEEVSRVLSSFYGKDSGMKLDGVILSGGSANLGGLEGYFSERLKTKVIIGNPFGRVAYNKEIEPLIPKIKSEMAVAVGLAIRGENKK
ncbi:MAG: type IV pilus assembly protein PilM [Patescibacteria group bacterium]